MADWIILPPHQPTQASLSTGAKEYGMSPEEARRMIISGGSLVATLPAVLTDLSGSQEKKVRIIHRIRI